VGGRLLLVVSRNRPDTGIMAASISNTVSWHGELAMHSVEGTCISLSWWISSHRTL